MTRGGDELAELSERQEALAVWMREKALPFWMTVGQDAPGLGFVEHLDLQARPTAVEFKRARSQARQIYVFSRAALEGIEGALAAAANGYSFLIRHGLNADGCFARRLGRYGGVLDPVVDLYENAFVLFAMAWYARASGSTEPIALAHRMLDWIEERMRTPSGEGFENAQPWEPGPRRQDSHMHFLEALLALYETTGEARFSTAASDLLGLFQRRLFDTRTGTLCELFADNWSRLKAPEACRIEPGHHFEWVWLLDEADRLLGADTDSAMRALYDFAVRHGVNEPMRWVVDRLDLDGRQVETSGRVWPQTEAIKAHCVMWRRGVRPAAAEAVRLVDLLLFRFLARSPPGTWEEHFDADGLRIGNRVPSTTLYHIAMALSELTRVISGTTPRLAPTKARFCGLR